MNVKFVRFGKLRHAKHTETTQISLVIVYEPHVGLELFVNSLRMYQRKIEIFIHGFPFLGYQLFEESLNRE